MSKPRYKLIAKDFAGLAVLVFGPFLLFIVLQVFGWLPWSQGEKFLKENWGNVASLWGLLVGFYVLVVAKGVRRAAQEARDREILRTLLDNLERANSNVRDLGLFVRESKWDMVYLKAVDVLAACRSAYSNWDDDPSSRKMRNKLNTAATITRSIATLTAYSKAQPMDERQKTKIIDAQLEVGELLGTVIGHVEKTRRKVTEP
jgi:hypothetical protein